MQLIDSGINVAPRSYILLFWDCLLIHIGITARDFIQVPQSQTRKMFYFSPQLQSNLPIQPPYGFTQLGGLIIDSLMTSHMLSEPVNVGWKKKQQQTYSGTKKKKSGSCVKVLSCVINRSSLSITDCQLPPSFEDQRDSWRTHRPQKHGRVA